jgi:hypothetical protein
MTPRAPWTKSIVEILEDGSWHTYDELVANSGPLVPPGRARREAERLRRHTAERRGPDLGRVRPTDELAVGRRSIVVHAVRRLAQLGRVEIKDRSARKARR